MIRLVVALLPLLAFANAPPGRTGNPEVLERLVGAWEGEGELFGRPAFFSMTWSPVLDGRFLRLEFANRIEAEDGSWSPVLEAIALYRVADGGEVRGTWFDSRGEILDLRAVASDSTLVTHWTAETERGRTTYRVIDDRTVEVVDEVHAEAGWRRFGLATYHRLAP